MARVPLPLKSFKEKPPTQDRPPACQKKLMARKIPSTGIFRPLAGIDVSARRWQFHSRVLKRSWMIGCDPAFSEIRKIVTLKLRTRPPPWAILAARAVMGGRGEEKRQAC